MSLSSTDSFMDQITIFKLVSILCIWLVGLIGGLIPVLLALKHTKSPLLSILNAFSGGVFLAGGFFHLLHSAIENAALRKWSIVNEGRYDFPYAEMFCTLGFLGLLLLEQAAQVKIKSDTDWKNHNTNTYIRAKHEDDDDDEFHKTPESDDTYLENIDNFEEERLDNIRSTNQLDHLHNRNENVVHDSETGSLAVAMVLFIALSFHSVLEGLGIGAQTETAWGVFLAIIMHKGLAAFALGSGLVQSAMPVTHVMLYMIVFSFMSIIGITVGWIIAVDSSEDSAAAGICVALASGTFIYVAVMEVIPQEFPRHSHDGGHDRHDHSQKSAMMLKKSIALVTGYAIFGLLAKWS
ncbi:unnamed protein product [Peronospora belbahrii]|uniref:Uncharacterized protein n=1 Tax=Peronospora belbahrii TaxID=622444 RepID=A0AAU9L3V6_9STRA|nr:unnamed protein product [Peronospora belbahrii]CAH0521698.1 unnamed protein product [Peronospora belbahrii]